MARATKKFLKKLLTKIKNYDIIIIESEEREITKKFKKYFKKMLDKLLKI